MVGGAMRKAAWICSFGVAASVVSAQVPERAADVFAGPALRLGRDADRAVIVERLARIERGRRDGARARALAERRPLRRVLADGAVHEIAFYEGDQPVYLRTLNANAAISTGANLLRSSPYTLNGSGIVIGMWDGGAGRASHQEFGGRLVVKDGSAAIDHASHVAGTLIASGVVSSARGMAEAASVDSYDWNSDLSEMTARGATSAGAADKLYLSNHSYGYIAGWSYVNGGSPFRVWEWHGSGTTAGSVDPDFGVYNSTARDQDSLAYSAPYYLIFRSAGNDRGENPSAGQAVALSPGGSTLVTYDPAAHPAGDPSYRGGYDTVSYASVAKNVITVGSVTDAVTAGLRDVAKANMSSFSSWGPTDDGRIKPDVVANGDGLYSTLGGGDASYGTYGGTSMSSPNACGSAALLVDQYARLFPGAAMRASTLKGLLIHTADDRGNAGPDYRFGWGLVNARAAADLLRDHQARPLAQRLGEDRLTTSVTSRSHSFVWDGVSPIRVTLCWTDPAGSATTTGDSRIARLVNDLQLKLIAPDGSEHLPFVMPFVGSWTQASMDLAATRGVNSTDNVEQVLLAAPPGAGTYRAVVSFAGVLTNGQQDYSLLLSGSAAEEPPPPPLALSAISPASGLAGALVTVDLTGSGLRADTAVKLSKSGQADILASSAQLIGETLRCQFSLGGAAPGLWTVSAVNPSGQSASLPDAFTVIGAIWSENFDGVVSGWSSSTETGSNAWSPGTARSHSPAKSYFASAPSTKSTCSLVSPAVTIPAAASNLQLKFWHNHELESARDGGRLEFSVNGGAWFDVTDAGSGAAFASNGYSGTISASGNTNIRSDFAGKSAWTGNNGGFVETVVNLIDTAKYAGKTLRMRWRLATNGRNASYGWHVDSVSLLGGGDFSNQPPSIVAAATTNSTETVTDPDSGIVYRIHRGNSATLSVQTADDGGAAGLAHTWTASGPSLVVFGINGTSAAASTAAEFQAAGDYLVTVAVTDAAGLSVSSSVQVRVAQTATGLVVDPPIASLAIGASQPFAGMVTDQFGDALAAQPGSFVWSASGGGAINSTGLYTAAHAGGPFTISATSNGLSGFASLVVVPTSAGVVLGNLTQTFDRTPKAVSVSTDPPGLPVAVSYQGQSAAPSAAGTYEVQAVVTDPDYSGTASGTLVIAPAQGWDAWVLDHFTIEQVAQGRSAESADPDHDGLPNLAEYGMGFDPSLADPVMRAVRDGEGFWFPFDRPAGRVDVACEAQSSEDMLLWGPALLEKLSEGDPERWRARDPLTSGPPAKRFLRLRFSR